MRNATYDSCMLKNNNEGIIMGTRYIRKTCVLIWTSAAHV